MKTRAAVVLAALSLVSATVFAADLKLGYVNTERIYREAGPSLSIQKKLEKEFSARHDELKKMGTRGKELQSMLARTNLPAEDRKRYEREYASLDRDWRARTRELAEDFNQRRNEEFAAVQEHANKLLKQIAQREQYDLILQDAVYVNPKYDLTDKLLKELGK